MLKRCIFHLSSIVTDAWKATPRTKYIDWYVNAIEVVPLNDTKRVVILIEGTYNFGGNCFNKMTFNSKVSQRRLVTNELPPVTSLSTEASVNVNVTNVDVTSPEAHFT